MKPGDFITWILVCDASRARIFSTTGPHKPWHLKKVFDHPSSRAKSSDLGSDHPGRSMQSSNHGSRSAMEPDTDPKEVEILKFAQELAAELEKNFHANEFSKLVIAAPPHFLGLLRKKIHHSVEKTIVQTIDKEYTNLPEKELMERIQLM